ncbi:MAG: hypothetical protein ACE361_08215 [Aureliella sp.]
MSTNPIPSNLPAHTALQSGSGSAGASAAAGVVGSKSDPIKTSRSTERSDSATPPASDLLDVASVEESSALENDLQGSNRDAATVRRKAHGTAKTSPDSTEHIDLTG